MWQDTHAAGVAVCQCKFMLSQSPETSPFHHRLLGFLILGCRGLAPQKFLHVGHHLCPACRVVIHNIVHCSCTEERCHRLLFSRTGLISTPDCTSMQFCYSHCLTLLECKSA